MKRSPLQRGSKPLKRSPLPRGGGPVGRSKKTKKVYTDERIPIVKRLLADRPICELCRTAPSSDVHEILSRGRSGGVSGTWWLEEENLLCLCRLDHTFVTDSPQWSETNGFSISSCRDEDVRRFLNEARNRRLIFYRTLKDSGEDLTGPPGL